MPKQTLTPDNDSGLAIGHRLREIRSQLGLSQRELARRAGVTNGMISLIEQDKTSPSVALLKKVLAGLPMSMGEFFASVDPSNDTPVFFKAKELPVINNGRIRFQQVGPHVGGRTLEILVEHYEPGADTGETMLSHEAQEGGVVLRGKVEVIVGQHRQILGPGDAYYFDSRLPHRFRNVGDEPVELISACTPPTF
jgi:transcriptional regulator with XRE-family HTH domain